MKNNKVKNNKKGNGFLKRAENFIVPKFMKIEKPLAILIASGFCATNAQAADLKSVINQYITPIAVSALFLAGLASYFANMSKISGKGEDADKKQGWMDMGKTTVMLFVIILVLVEIIGKATSGFTF
jgi:hypothetical protein